ncbi:leukocyte receptor cluster member 9 isoform 1-T3 [Discoglossus pictus]
MDEKSKTLPEHTSASPAVDTEEANSETTENEATEVAEASDTVQESPICQFFLMGRCRFGERCKNSHIGLSEDSPPLVNKKKHVKENISQPKGKKPPMKTAVDVISRIQWDTHLPTEMFSIGYLDRFVGIIEKPFSAFCWEDLASVSLDVLAIPKHRIQYFKYRDLIVWDKNTRTDNVFGSTGSGMTILDIIDNYETLLETEENLQREDQAPFEESEDVLFMEQEPSHENSNVEDTDKKFKPSHFVAVRINNEEVRNAVEEIQNVLQKNNPHLAEFCSPLPTLHLTLCLLRLETPEEIQTALTALHEMKHEIQRLLPPSLILTFTGLNDFYSRVLYLAPSSIPEICKFAKSLDQTFRSKGLTLINSPDYKNFHLTIAKIPKMALKRNPSLRLTREVYANTQVTEFGAQHVDSLSFCCTGGSRRTDGFYTTLLELPLF